MNPSDETPLGPVVASVPPPPPVPVHVPASTRTSLAPWIVTGIAMGAVGTVGVLAFGRALERRLPYPRTSVTVVQAAAPKSTEPTPAPEAADGIPHVSLDALPIVPSTKGTLLFPPSARGHRIYVDGVVRAEGDAPLDVPCGSHDVRVGSRGELHTIDVACGGSVIVPDP